MLESVPSIRVMPVASLLTRLASVFLITGTYYPALYYGFYGQPVYQIVYIAGVTMFGARELCRLASVYVGLTHSVSNGLFCLVYWSPPSAAYLALHRSWPVRCDPYHSAGRQSRGR